MSARIKHGQVKGSSIDVPINAQGGNSVRNLLVNSMGAIQKAQLLRGAGEDHLPQNGAHVIVLEIDQALLFAIATDDNSAPAVSAGERKIYAYDSSGNPLGYVYLKSDGKITIANQTENLLAALVNLITGILGMTAGGYPMVDATTLVNTAKTQLQGLLE